MGRLVDLVGVLLVVVGVWLVSPALGLVVGGVLVLVVNWLWSDG